MKIRIFPIYIIYTYEKWISMEISSNTHSKHMKKTLRFDAWKKIRHKLLQWSSPRPGKSSSISSNNDEVSYNENSLSQNISTCHINLKKAKRLYMFVCFLLFICFKLLCFFFNFPESSPGATNLQSEVLFRGTLGEMTPLLRVPWNKMERSNPCAAATGTHSKICGKFTSS